MKKLSKILAVLFVLVLSCGVFALCASADSSSPAPQSEDITDFKMKINITLYDYFVYNVYLPKSVGDAATEIKVDGIAVPKEEWTTTEIDGAEYYVFRKEFNVVNANDSFPFTVNFEGGKTKTHNLSIREYADIVANGNYSQAAKDIVSATMTYITAARDYFELTSNLGTVKDYSYEAEELPPLSDAVKSVLSSATLVLDEGRLVFRFYLQSGVSEYDKVMTFRYSADKTTVSVTTTPEDFTNGYYDVTLRAKDMRENIEIILGDDDTAPADLTYSLHNYYYYVLFSGESFNNRAKLVALINTLYDYSVKAAAYSHENDANEDTDTATVIYYSQYGAVGDGVTNDFRAIYNAHVAANELRAEGEKVIVKADKNKTYHIANTAFGGKVLVVPIKTDVDWGNAKFIIDDDILNYNGAYAPSGSSNYRLADYDIFKVESDYAMTKITDEAILNRIVADGLNPDTKRINLGLGYPAMIIPFNEDHNIYKRKGYGGHTGYAMREVIVLDKYGNVDPETKLAFTYTNVDYIEVYRLDMDPLTIEGGHFTTKAPSVNCINSAGNPVDNRFLRGIEINRSYTTLKNVQHYVTNEVSLERQAQGEIGATYNAFYHINQTHGVTLDSCVLTGRRCYNRVYVTDANSTPGTYDMQVMYSNKTVFKDCTQSNFWVNDNAEAVAEGTNGAKLSMDNSTLLPMQVVGSSKVRPQMHWGIGGSNDCKNMEYHGCTLSRFDAHRGLFGGKIVNSSVNCISLSGGGELLIENSRVFCENENNNYLVHLRQDYGSNWNGDVIIQDVRLYPHPEAFRTGNTTYFPVYLFYHNYTNWDFGYECHFPNVLIDNLQLYDRLTWNRISGDQIIINIMTNTKSVEKENNLHLDTVVGGTAVSGYDPAPWYCYEDKNGDGFVDGTTIAFDKTLAAETIRNGVQVKDSSVNVNPIVPPDYIKIYNNTDYEFSFPNTSVTSFFANTEIVITADDAPVAPPPTVIIVDREEESPIVNY